MAGVLVWKCQVVNPAGVVVDHLAEEVVDLEVVETAIDQEDQGNFLISF
jgi:hypothetical protein